MLKVRREIVWALAALVVVGLGCSRKEMVARTFYPMGGIPFTIKAYNVPESLFDETADAIEQETERLEQVFSVHRADSEVSRLNREGSIQASPDLARVARAALKIAVESDGAFDVTIGPVLDLWRYSAREKRWPTEDEVRQRMALVDYNQLHVSGSDVITLKQKNMSVDFGGIAKGLIVDMAAQRLKKQGIRRGIVDAGGDLVLFNSVGEAPFKVGIKHPERPDSRFAIMALDSGAVVTSGCYERFEIVEDRKVCHIVDPRTGYPVSELLSVTVVAQEAVTADGLATAVMVLGNERGQALIRSLPGVEGVLVWKTGDTLEWWISPGLQGKVKVEQQQ